MFRDFSRFEIEDFAFDESFQKWVRERTPEECAFWESYLNEYPHQVDKILAARELVQKLSGKQPSEEEEYMAEAIWSQVKSHVNRRRGVAATGWRWKYAAAAVLVMAGTFLFFTYPEGPAREGRRQAGSEARRDMTPVTEYVNEGEEVKRIVLDDGSVVNLERNSRIVHTKEFHARNRVVYLYGEAFFDIRKDPRHPFIIFANKTVVKVLGTSFRIKAYDDAPKVVVSVRSGKVSVFERKYFESGGDNPQVPGLVLAANQQAEFSTDLEKFSKLLVPEPLLVAGASKKEFDFDQTPLSKVFETLEKAYGIEIIYDRDLAEGRRLKIGLEDESLFEKLDLICKTMGLTYHVVDARIIVENQ